MPQSRRPAHAVLVALLLVVVLAACSPGGPGGDEAGASGTEAPVDGLVLVATTSVLGDVVGRLVGEDVVVRTLLPTGADSHSYSASAADVRAIREADLVIANGGSLEEGLVDAIAAAESDGVEVFRALDHVDAIGVADPSASADGAHAEEDDHEEDDHEEDDHEEDDHEEEGPHGHAGGADPHFWMDPVRMGQAVTALAERLAAIQTEVTAQEWTARAAQLVTELDALDQQIVEVLAVVPDERRQMVTNHDAFAYFADRYGFDVVATVIPGSSTLAEPSAADLQEVVDAIEATGVQAIFTETSAPARLAEIVAAEVGGEVAVVSLYTESLSAADGPAGTYEALLRFNAEAIADALG